MKYEEWKTDDRRRKTVLENPNGQRGCHFLLAQCASANLPFFLNGRHFYFCNGAIRRVRILFIPISRLGDCEICRKDHYYVIFDVSVRETYGSFARSFFAKILDRSEVTLSSRE